MEKKERRESKHAECVPLFLEKHAGRENPKRKGVGIEEGEENEKERD